MFSDNPAAGSAESPGRRHILLLFQNHDLASHDTGHTNPVKKGEYQENTDQVNTDYTDPFKSRLLRQILQRIIQHGSQQNDDQNIGNRIYDIDNTHHHHIDPSAEKSGD